MLRADNNDKNKMVGDYLELAMASTVGVSTIEEDFEAHTLEVSRNESHAFTI